MKKLMTLVMMMFVSTAVFAYAGDEPVETELTVGVNDAYIPNGFDSNSDAFVVVSGLFSNSCYKLKGAEVNHVGPMLHEVSVKATVTEGLCLMVMVPFHKEVHIGKLGVGDHALRFLNGDGTFWEKHLTIEQ